MTISVCESLYTATLDNVDTRNEAIGQLFSVGTIALDVFHPFSAIFGEFKRRIILCANLADQNSY